MPKNLGKDLDRGFATIINDVIQGIKKDHINTANQVADKINDVSESVGADGDVSVLRTDKGAVVKAKIDCPTKNAVDFINGVDNAVKSTFRYGTWSDMKVN